MAALARPVAGTIGKTLVVTLPGSAKAVRESIESILSSGIIGHAVELIKGGTGSTLHSELAKNDAESRGHHSHHHAHHHHHRRQGPSRDEGDNSKEEYSLGICGCGMSSDIEV